MAKNVELMGAVFPDCPAVMLPTHEGPLARFTDVSDSQAVAADVAQGKQFYLADGTKTIGTNQGGGGGGGGGGTIKPNARLVLIDYDGSIVDSYTQSEIDALSALPANPDHSGDEIPLTSQGWNWTLAEVREQLAAMPEQAVYVGNVVIPTDGKTHILIYIDPEAPDGRMDMTVRFAQSVNNGVTVSWGDGSNPETYSGIAAAEHNHVYATSGWYDITLEVTNGTINFAGTSGSGYSIYGSKSSSNTYKRTRIRHIWFGNGLVAISGFSYSMTYSRGLKTVSIPTGVTSPGEYVFQFCDSLESIVYPRGITSVSSYVFNYDYSLKTVSMPKGLTMISSNAFQYCYSLRNCPIQYTTNSISSYAFNGCNAMESATIPSLVTKLNSQVLNGCYNLQHLIIQEGLTTINGSSLVNLPALTVIRFPASLTSIASGALNNNYGIKAYHLKATTPPSLGSAINGMAADCVIYVPYSEDHSILAAYQAAKNWSNYASRMVEEAE